VLPVKHRQQLQSIELHLDTFVGQKLQPVVAFGSFSAEARFIGDGVTATACVIT